MTQTPGILVCHAASHTRALRKHTVNQMFRMKQSSEDGVYDPDLVALLESIPKSDEEDPKVKATPKAKAGGNQAKTTPQKTTPPKTGKEAQGKDGPPQKKPKTSKKKAGAKKASKKKPTNDDGSQEEESDEWMTSDGEHELSGFSCCTTIIVCVVHLPCFEYDTLSVVVPGAHSQIWLLCRGSH